MSSSPKIEPAFLDLAGASAYTSLSQRTLRRLIAMPGGLPHHRIGSGKILVRRIDLDNFLSQHRREPLDIDRLASEALAELGK